MPCHIDEHEPEVLILLACALPLRAPFGTMVHAGNSPKRALIKILGTGWTAGFVSDYLDLNFICPSPSYDIDTRLTVHSLPVHTYPSFSSMALRHFSNSEFCTSNGILSPL
jgi:hypothetical protein